MPPLPPPPRLRSRLQPRRPLRVLLVAAPALIGCVWALTAGLHLGLGSSPRAAEPSIHSRSSTVSAPVGASATAVESQTGPAALLNAPAPKLRDFSAWLPGDALGSPPRWTSIRLESIESEILVLAFLSNSCPVTMAYERRLIAFADRYGSRSRSVRMIAIAVNPFESDKPPALAQRMRERGYNFAYGHQDAQTAVRDYRIETTPTFFVLDRDRVVRYAGAFDDDFKAAKASRPHLENAIEALLADEPVTVPYVKSRGSAVVLRGGARPNDPRLRESEGVRP